MHWIPASAGMTGDILLLVIPAKAGIQCFRRFHPT
jgi:hypothetical protein